MGGNRTAHLHIQELLERANICFCNEHKERGNDDRGTFPR